MLYTLAFLLVFMMSVTMSLITEDYSISIAFACLSIFALGMTLLSYVTTYKE